MKWNQAIKHLSTQCIHIQVLIASFKLFDVTNQIRQVSKFSHFGWRSQMEKRGHFSLGKSTEKILLKANDDQRNDFIRQGFYGHLWPRAMLKGPKRSFVVLVHEQKLFKVEQNLFANKIYSKWNQICSKGNQNVHQKYLFQIEQKCCKKNQNCSQWKLLQMEQKVAISKWQNHIFMAICGLVGPSGALSELFCSCMAFYGIAWPCMV